MLLFTLGIFLSSCSDDPLSESILGTWEFTTIEATGCDDETDNIALTGVDDNNCFTAFEEVICDLSIVFSINNMAVQSLIEDGDVDTDEFTYTIDDENEIP